MTLTIHMGIKKDEIQVLNKQIKRMVPDGIDIRTQFDLWDAWGEEGHEDIDEFPIHVCIDTTTPMTILNLVASRFDSFLFPRFDGPKLVVTDTDDYDVEYLEFRFPE